MATIPHQSMNRAIGRSSGWVLLVVAVALFSGGCGGMEEDEGWDEAPGEEDASGEDLERSMQTIFVMVKCELGKAYAVADDAVAVEQVSEVYSTSGQYDLLMKCYLDDKTDIGHFVTSRIQTLAGVKDTFTLITFKAFA